MQRVTHTLWSLIIEEQPICQLLIEKKIHFFTFYDLLAYNFENVISAEWEVKGFGKSTGTLNNKMFREAECECAVSVGMTYLWRTDQGNIATEKAKVKNQNDPMLIN